MFGRLQQRADAAGRCAVEAATARLAAEAVLPPGVSASADADRVTFEGRGLKHRMLNDPRLRSIGR